MSEHDFRTNASEGADILNEERNRYRRAFWIALAATVVLAIVALSLWWRLNQAATGAQPGNNSANSEPMAAMGQPSSASGSGSEPETTGDPRADNMQETSRAPIQLTPQRMQSIGIVLGKVESKPVNAELRFYGNVQVDERRQAYVQTRFAGWIRKVYADATGNFIGKGHPLFTIYSPDLVATEQEYL
ncbi:MAG: hypothetical protein DMG85_17710, partial [Acidobacteria bacterium]